MYLEFFGLERPPFNITPDSRFLYLSRRHREALASLEYGITSRQGFIVLTGAIGAGKTTLCRSLLRRLPDSTKIALVLNSYLSDFELLQAINDELGIEYNTDGGKKGLIDALNGRLIEELAENNAVVLVIDEAQNLSPQTLEQVRMLSNLETESDKLLQIVLMGQPELRGTLKLPELEQLNQRITVRYHLLPLSHEEVGEYIEHRLKIAGEEHKAEFDEGAIEAIWEYAGGVPRKMNVVCDRALLAAYGQESHTITKEIVAQAIEEVAGADFEEGETSAEKKEDEEKREASQDNDERTADLLSRVSQQILAHQITQQTATHQLPPQQIGGPGYQAYPGYAAAPPYGAQPAPPPGYTGYAAQPQAAPVPQSAQQITPNTGTSGLVKTGIFLGVVLVCITLLAAGGLTLYAIRPDLFARFGAPSPGAGGQNQTAMRSIPGGLEAYRVDQSPAPAPTPSVTSVPTPPTFEPTPAPTARPKPPQSTRPTPRPGPPDWTTDVRGVVRVSDPQYSRLAAELTMMSLVHGAKINTSRFGQLAQPLLNKLSVLDLPEFQQRGLSSVALEVNCEDALEMDVPLILSFDLPRDSSASPNVLLLKYEKGRRKATLADPRNGMMMLPLSNLKKVYLGATAYFFDENRWVGIEQGDESAEVESLQRALQQVGAWPSGVGGPDGKFTLFTIQALRNFQRKNRLPVSGEVDDQTVFYLLRSMVGDETGPTREMQLDEGWVAPEAGNRAGEEAADIESGNGFARSVAENLAAPPQGALADPLMIDSPTPAPVIKTNSPEIKSANDKALEERAAALAAELGLKPKSEETEAPAGGSSGSEGDE